MLVFIPKSEGGERELVANTSRSTNYCSKIRTQKKIYIYEAVQKFLSIQVDTPRIYQFYKFFSRIIKIEKKEQKKIRGTKFEPFSIVEFSINAIVVSFCYNLWNEFSIALSILLIRFFISHNGRVTLLLYSNKRIGEYILNSKLLEIENYFFFFQIWKIEKKFIS